MGRVVNAMQDETTRIHEEIGNLRQMTTAQLKEKYREVFGEETRSNHKQFLFRRIAWRIQANAWGGLSQRARRRALEIANDADLRIRATKNFLKEEPDKRRNAEACVLPTADPRLPLPGARLVHRFRGEDVVVLVRNGEFEYERRLYRSLSAAVRAAKGTPWDGFAFFALGHRPGRGRGERQSRQRRAEAGCTLPPVHLPSRSLPPGTGEKGVANLHGAAPFDASGPNIPKARRAGAKRSALPAAARGTARRRPSRRFSERRP